MATGQAGAVQVLAELQGVPAGGVLTAGAPSALRQATILHNFRLAWQGKVGGGRGLGVVKRGGGARG